MLKYIDTFKTGAEESCLTITKSHYFYETSTGVMYVQCAYSHSLNLRDPAFPLFKPDGTYLTYTEWLATQDDERDERVLEKVRDCSDCKACSCDHTSINYHDLER